MEHVNAVVDALTLHAADKPGSGVLDPKAGHLAACCKLLFSWPRRCCHAELFFVPVLL